jgi:hypothetical protein
MTRAVAAQAASGFPRARSVRVEARRIGENQGNEPLLM